MNIHTKAHIHIHEYMCVHEHMCSGVPQKHKSRPPLLRFKYWFIICVVFTGANFRHWHDQQQPPLHWPSSTFILSTITKQRFLTFYIYIQDINTFAHAFQHITSHISLQIHCWVLLLWVTCIIKNGCKGERNGNKHFLNYTPLGYVPGHYSLSPPTALSLIHISEPTRR